MNNKDKEQKEHIDAWINNNCKGTSIAATGIGKTKMGLMAIDHILSKDIYNKALIVVPTENLRDNEWPNELKKWKLSKYKDRIDIQCIQTVYKWENYTCSILIVDEVHTTLSYEYRNLYENNSFDNIYCLTATEPENDEYKEYLKGFAPTIKKTDTLDALDLELVSPYKVYNLGVSFTEEEVKEYKRFDTLFNKATNELGGRFVAFENATKLKNSKDKEEAKWANIFYMAMQKRKNICYNAVNKVELIKKIVNKFPNRKGLVFSQSINFAENLQDILGEECITFHSKMKLKDKKRALKEFGDGRTKVRLISSVKALNAGLNVPECSLGICAAGSSKALDNIQRRGRVLRMIEGKQALYINLYVRGTQEVKWVRKRTQNDYNCEWIETLNEILT
ncbi:MAG: putative ATP-dependent DNA helicase [Prokaryotic dsDNA virus sp.]|nr:MAG: putative ATP-dependent DNA helicase [Prokaryotic dsDNA virus sp.]|tara:strand:+ start:10093 stop:11271 length:1179 start_codon:yes stop_codon:yes gene_type:complete